MKACGHEQRKTRYLRTIVGLVGCAIIILPVGMAVGAPRRLSLHDAQAVAERIAQADARREVGFPTYVSVTGPTCRKLSRRHVRCLYTVRVRAGDPSEDPNAPYTSSSCRRRVDVRLVGGRARGHRRTVRCESHQPQQG